MKPWKKSLLLLPLVAAAFAAGLWYGEDIDRAPAEAASSTPVLHYICPMHPQYISDRPGTAPCCGMRLEPVYQGQADRPASLPPGAIQVSLKQQQLIGVRTGLVEKRPLRHTIRTLGQVTPDERLVYRVTAGLDGWVRDTYSDSTGSVVQKNDRLATVYSPMYRNAQQAFLTALGHLETARTHLQRAPEQLQSVENSYIIYRDGLRNLGMGDPQIEEISRTKEYTENIHLYSPATGFVLSRNVSPGQKFVNGEELYRIAGLDRVWVLADLFENEARYVRPGQKVKVSYQGRDYSARVSHVLPQFDPDSRTLKVRLEMNNEGYVLRPDMFVDVEFPVELEPATTVPVDAVIDSGLRKTVYVDLGEGYFEPRLVETGWRFGDAVQITKGLDAGEKIVISGNFLLDSESRMKAAAAGVQTPAKDPVCGMDVDQRRAKAAGRTSEHQGHTYYFCADHCKKEFDENPSHYVEPAPEQKESQPAKTAIDPVCGMEVSVAGAKYTSEYRGTTYYFCNETCKNRFDKNPDRYLKRVSLGTAESQHPVDGQRSSR